jgi:hypothetical protein
MDMITIYYTLLVLYFGLGIHYLGKYMDRKGYSPMWPIALPIWPVFWRELNR